MRPSNLTARLATSLVAAPVLIGLLVLGSAALWYGVVLAAVILAAAELFSMTHPADRVAQGFGVLTSVAVSVTVYVLGSDSRALLTLILALPLGGLLLHLWRLGTIETASARMMTSIAGPLYTGALLTTLAMLRRDLGDVGPAYVILTLALAWLGDTGAYFVGRFLGKRALYPKVSPKKTRAGLVGAVVGACCASLLVRFSLLPALSLEHALGLGVAGGVLGQLGDLIESVLKRSTGVKDSGRLLPGHGGILDRIDALLVVSPVVYLYVLWTGLAGG